MLQLCGMVGALLVLTAYAGLQTKRLNSDGVVFNLCNFVGSALLGVVAVADNRWGFIVLETVWCLVTLPSLLAAVRGKR